MSNVSLSTARVIVAAQHRVAQRTEAAIAGADYLATILVAVALVMCVFAIVTSGGINGVLQTLIERALGTATGLIN